jgi:hypothetical protein
MVQGLFNVGTLYSRAEGPLTMKFKNHETHSDGSPIEILKEILSGPALPN